MTKEDYDFYQVLLFKSQACQPLTPPPPPWPPPYRNSPPPSLHARWFLT